ncbi:hypothetical protein [Agrococcus lahaulensis]|uniref:hypothetical protein n=1 Tax=Agrococcus lahaulensis TaxID=341722 RepID=UPI0012EC38C8|nr:hypothetical protein [Agrococcus lahaulensis]
MSLVISLVLLGLGIGQRTIWAPPETIVAQVAEPTESQVVVIPGEAMNAHDGVQTLTVEGEGPVTAVVGRSHDVEGWIGESAHAIASVDETDALVLDEQRGDEEPLPAIAGNDMWIEEAQGEGSLELTIDLPVGYAVAITGAPGEAAPAAIGVAWPFDAKTPLFGPLITAGLVFLALALLFLLLALRHHRRRRGPQRRSHRELSRAERRALRREAQEGLPLPAKRISPATPGGERGAIEADASTPSSEDAASESSPGPDAEPGAAASAPEAGTASAPDAPERESGTRERRATRSRRGRFGLVALPVVAIVGLTGCGPQYWPSGESEAVPTDAPTPSTLEETLPPVALTENQFDRVLESTRETVAEADAALDAGIAERRLAGPMLEARRTNYQVRSQNAELAEAPGIPDGDVELLLPQQTEVWPRSVMAVVGWQDGAQAQSALMFQQPDARSNYRLVYMMTLASGVQLPAVASPTIGAASLPGDTPLLLHQPNEITAAYADVILNGAESQYNAWFREEGDALRAEIGRPAKDAMRALPEFELSNLEWSVAEDEQAPMLLVTNEGGALLATSFLETQRTTPRESGVEIEAQAGAGILAGVQQSDTGIETTYQIQVLFSVPPADAPEGTQIQVVGYSQSLVSAREVQ